MFTELKGLKMEYRSLADDLVKDFYSPILKKAIHYKRAVGYFTSTSIQLLLKELPVFIQNGGKVYIIASPRLNPDDINDINEGYLLREDVMNIIDKEVEHIIEELDGNQIGLLAFLISRQILDIKIAFFEDINRFGLYHEKIGIFEDSGGNSIAFTGSMNETLGALKNNYESIDVYYSWKESDRERVEIKNSVFEKLWQDRINGLSVLDFPEIQKERLIKYLDEFDHEYYSAPELEDMLNNKWKHQEEAVEVFIEKEHGILEMCTGSGKTRTSIKAINRLFNEDKIDTVVVTTYGNDLLQQWYDVLLEDNNIHNLVIQRKYGIHNDLDLFLINSKNKVLVLSRNEKNLNNIIDRMTKQELDRTLMVFDEVHGLGSETLNRSLAGKIINVKYRLGLSATPEREYDEEGNQFIEQEIGNTIYSFGVQEAIENGILCEFKYIPLEYQLTDIENKRIKSIMAKYNQYRKNNISFEPKDMAMEISNIRKTALNKLEKFKAFLMKDASILDYCLIFVETIEYGGMVQSILIDFIEEYHVYYANSDRSNLENFANGTIKVLVTCKKVNEGIDIKKCKNIILFSSDKSKLTTIQRIGRALRTSDDPDKKGTVVDFVDSEYQTDLDRKNLIHEMSNARRKP